MGNLMYFLCLILLARRSSVILIESGGGGYILAQFSFLLFSMKLTVGFLFMPFIRFRKFPSFLFTGSIYKNLDFVQ